MFNKILVPLDGSKLAERALEPALVLAQQGSGTVILLSVPVLRRLIVTEPGGYGMLLPDQSFEHSRRELMAYLEDIQESRAHPDLRIQKRVADGDEASVIIDTAKGEDVDLIVMSTHGRSGISRWVMGSVTERVLRSAPCPVLVMREEKSISKVLITLDGSDLSEQALEPGMAVARLLGCEVILLRAKEKIPVRHEEVAQLESVEGGLGKRLESSAYESENSYLQAMAQRYQYEMEQPVKTAVTTGPVAASILEFAELSDVDLIVMATHGRSGIQRWVYGSVTEKVLRGAPCAVMVIRPSEYQFD